MKQIRLVISIIIISITSFHLQAQNTVLPNGSSASNQFMEAIISNYPAENALDFDPSFVNLDVTLHVNFFIIKSTAGQVDFAQSQLDDYIDLANEYFAPIGIRYVKNSVNAVSEYEYSYVYRNPPPFELTTKYSTPNNINVYFVDSVFNDTVPCYGYSNFPTDTGNSNIFLSKGQTNAKNFCTQLGHFMGLLATHEKLGDSEFVDGTNCALAGDYICDTYADNGILAQVDGNCIYLGIEVDNKGDFFTPSVANLMSDAPEKCRCVFTNQQYRRMYFYYKKYRQNLK